MSLSQIYVIYTPLNPIPEVVEGQVGVGEVDVVGARVEHFRQDGHDGDHPYQPDYGANSSSLEYKTHTQYGESGTVIV